MSKTSFLVNDCLPLALEMSTAFQVNLKLLRLASAQVFLEQILLNIVCVYWEKKACLQEHSGFDGSIETGNCLDTLFRNILLLAR